MSREADIIRGYINGRGHTASEALAALDRLDAQPTENYREHCWDCGSLLHNGRTCCAAGTCDHRDCMRHRSIRRQTGAIHQDESVYGQPGGPMIEQSR